ncbi:hypothetical protein M9H77_25518 [Catharanthus roseus]|uniref:Uncharacterized protein n=1 Tax=Catharanthus roseus TaxID=4058 RepID=A0ACC0A752_CATRO|nr:hypothetical protein M9H77_25518 [Catharanthus roseus]
MVVAMDSMLMVETTMEMETSVLKDINGVGNFSSYAKSYGHTSYDDYGGYDGHNANYDYYEHSPYDCYERNRRQRRNMEKELGAILEELSISLSLNPSLMCYEVSRGIIIVFRVLSVSIYGDLCTISFGGGLFLVVPYVSKYLSSHVSLEEQLMNSGVKFDPSCYGFGMLDNASFVDPNIVGFGLECALFDVLQDKYIGKYDEQCDYVLPILDYQTHDPFDSPSGDASIFTLGLTLDAPSHPSGAGTSYVQHDPFDSLGGDDKIFTLGLTLDASHVRPPSSVVGTSYAPPPLSAVGLPFDAPPPPREAGLSMPRIFIFRASSSDSKKYGDELADEENDEDGDDIDGDYDVSIASDDENGDNDEEDDVSTPKNTLKLQ